MISENWHVIVAHRAAEPEARLEILLEEYRKMDLEGFADLMAGHFIYNKVRNSLDSDVAIYLKTKV